MEILMPLIQFRDILTYHTRNLRVRLWNCPNKIKAVIWILDLPLPSAHRCESFHTNRFCYLCKLVVLLANEDIPRSMISFCCLSGAFSIIPANGGVDGET